MTITRRCPDFFVVGTPRSGTTLARAILTGHPDIEVPGETGFLPRLIRLRRLWWGKDGVRAKTFVRLAFANGRLDRSGLDRDAVVTRLASLDIRVPLDAIGAIYEEFGRAAGASIVGDKTPGYVDDLELLAESFPRARFIQMVRHPLDVIESLKSQPWGPNNDLAAAWMWDRSQRRAKSVGLGPERLLVVRLEDLIEDPAETVESMAKHIGVDVVPEMLAFSGRAQRIADQNIHPAGHAGLYGELRRTRHWKTDSSSGGSDEAWAIVQEMAVQFGYDGPDAAVAAKRNKARLKLGLFNVRRSWRRVNTLKRIVHQ